MQVDQVIAAYRQLRENKEAIAKRHKEELAPLNKSMEQLEAWLHKQLLAQGLTNFKGASGTAFFEEEISVTVEDFNAFLQWVQGQNAWEFLEKRASKTVVKDFVDAYEEVPPGLKYSAEKVVRVRKS